MHRMLPLVLTSMLAVPLIATPKLPAARIKVAVIKAIRAGDAKVLAAVLAEHGLHVNSALWAAGGDTLLHYAADEGSPEVVEYMIKHGAQVNVANLRGYTPLDEATTFGIGRTEIVTLLEKSWSYSW